MTSHQSDIDWEKVNEQNMERMKKQAMDPEAEKKDLEARKQLFTYDQAWNYFFT